MNELSQGNNKRRRIFIWISILCLVFFILDRILKYLALAGKIFYQENSGLAFSIAIPERLSLYFYILVFLILFFLIWQLIRLFLNYKLPLDSARGGQITNYGLRITSYELLILGSISNLIDRLKFGFIIDYFNFGFFSNNLADLMIGAGVAILITSLLRRDLI